MESYPSWQSQLANRVEAQWPLTCKAESTEDAFDLVQKLLQWSPGRPPEFKFEAIPPKAMEVVL